MLYENKAWLCIKYKEADCLRVYTESNLTKYIRDV